MLLKRISPGCRSGIRCLSVIQSAFDWPIYTQAFPQACLIGLAGTYSLPLRVYCAPRQSAAQSTSCVSFRSADCWITYFLLGWGGGPLLVRSGSNCQAPPAIIWPGWSDYGDWPDVPPTTIAQDDERPHHEIARRGSVGTGYQGSPHHCSFPIFPQNAQKLGSQS